MEIKINDLDEGITLFTLEGEAISQIESTYVPKSIYGVKGLYINRLIVPKKVRGQGIATELMKKFVSILDSKKINAILEINAYGDLDEDQLKRFYKKFGFEVENVEDLYIRRFQIEK